MLCKTELHITLLSPKHLIQLHLTPLLPESVPLNASDTFASKCTMLFEYNYVSYTAGMSQLMRSACNLQDSVNCLLR